VAFAGAARSIEQGCVDAGAVCNAAGAEVCSNAPAGATVSAEAKCAVAKTMASAVKKAIERRI